MLKFSSRKIWPIIHFKYSVTISFCKQINSCSRKWPVHHLLPQAARKCRAFFFDRWIALPSAMCTKTCCINSLSNCPNQILHLSNNKTGACGRCKCLCSTPETPELKICCFHSTHNLVFFFNSSFDQQTRKSYFLSFWCWHWFIQLLEIIIFWMYILPWFLLSFTVWQNMLTWMGPTWIQSNF